MKRNMNKSLKAGVSVTFSNSLDALNTFYQMNLHTRKNHGIPPQPKKFFQKIHEHVLAKNMGTVALASHAGKDIAGAVFFHFGTSAIYKYGASYNSGKPIRANNLVMWEAIRFYNNNGYKDFIFGRTEFENTGLRDYKMGYNSEEYIIPYYKYDLRRDCPARKKQERGMDIRKTYRFVPIPLSKLVGELIYSHIG